MSAIQQEILGFVTECEQKMFAFRDALKVDQNALLGIAEHCREMFITYRLIGARNLETLWELKTFGYDGEE